MHVKLHELRQGSSVETYVNDLDTLARHLELPEQKKIHYFIFGLKPKLKQALLIRQLQTYDDAVTFAKRKHHFADTNLDTHTTQIWTSCKRYVRNLVSNILESNENRTQLMFTITIQTTFNRKSPNSKRICKVSRTQ